MIVDTTSLLHEASDEFLPNVYGVVVQCYNTLRVSLTSIYLCAALLSRRYQIMDVQHVENDLGYG